MIRLRRVADRIWRGLNRVGILLLSFSTLGVPGEAKCAGVK